MNALEAEARAIIATEKAKRAELPRRLALADTLRAAASRIVGGADPGAELATLRAAVQAWELGT